MAGYDIEINAQPYLPDPSSWGPGAVVPWQILPTPGPFGYLQDGFWVFGSSGGVWMETTSGETYGHAAWWSSAYYQNHVQTVQYRLAPSPVQMLGLWNSTGPDLAGQHPAPTLQDNGITLRTEFTGFSVWGQQACRIGKVHPSRTTPQAVVAGPDGKVLLLDSTPGASVVNSDAILTQSQDLGFGGQALAVQDLDGDGYHEVLFAPYWCQVDSQGKPAQARLYVLKHNGTDFTTLATADLGDPTLLPQDFPGYGACGVAVANLDGTGGPEVLVTTLNGELIVFGWSNGPPPTLTTLHRRIVEGAIGAFNSIVIADLLAGDGKPEVYLAGSSGIRRFDT